MSEDKPSARPEFEKRLRFETLIADLSSKFVNLPAGEVDREIEGALRRVCELIGIDFASANALARQRTDQALHESEERMTLAAEAAEFGVWVWSLARNQVWGSERWLRLFGFAAGEDVSFETVIQRMHPDDRETVEREVRRAVANRNDYVGEFRAVLPDGTQRWIASRGRAYPDANGTPARMIGAAIDITERKRTEEALRASEARLAAGTELAGLGYYEVDYGARTCFLDDRFREICGLPPELRQGLEPVQFWMEHVHPDDRQLLSHERGKLHAGKVDRIVAEYRYLHPANGQRWLHHSARCAGRSAAGDGIRTYGVVRDITEAKQSEAEVLRQRAELAHAARVSTLGELAASVAHELNQPLGAILANAEAAELFLQQNPPALDELRAILADIRKDDERAGEVIRRMRALLRKRALERLPLEINSLVEDVLQLVSGDAALRGVSLSADLGPSLPQISGDRVHLQQVLLNLILNGMDALADQPRERRRISVRTRLGTDNRVELAVIDSGPGLEPDSLLRLFEPFYTTKPHGMGMGLSIARTIIEAHHGRIWADNHASGGAVFRIALPTGKKEQGSGFGVQGSGFRENRPSTLPTPHRATLPPEP